MRRGFIPSALAACLVMGVMPASADIVWNQAPNQRGGFVSDTDQTFFGQPHYWQQMADDFRLNQPADITQIVYWGFHFAAIYAPPEEAMRVRFYGSRESDGLPDESMILYEQTVQNPLRQETGELVDSIYPVPDYRYSIDLATPVSLAADNKYWLEIVQLGYPDSDFAWESAATTSPQDRIAGKNALHPNWDYVSGRAGQAFQLLTPEPTTAMFFFLWMTCAARGKRKCVRDFDS